MITKRVRAIKQGGELRADDGELAQAVAGGSSTGLLGAAGVEVEFAEIEEVRRDGQVRTARREGGRGGGVTKAAL